MVTTKCQGCRVEFGAERKSAKWCSDRCRKRTRRGASVPTLTVVPGATGDPPTEPGLVAAVRAELETAGRQTTVPGLVALTMAKRVTDPTSSASSVATLSRELRVVLAEAMAGTAPTRDRFDGIADEVARKRDRKAVEDRDPKPL